MMEFLLWATGQINGPHYESRESVFDSFMESLTGWVIFLGVIAAFIAFIVLITVLTLRGLGVIA